MILTRYWLVIHPHILRHQPVRGLQPSYGSPLNLFILALKHFDPFSQIEKDFIIITSEEENDIPESVKQFKLKTTLSRPSIELSVTSDGPAIVESDISEKVLILRADKNLNEHIQKIESSLKEKYGNGFILSVITEGLIDDSLSGDSQRQLLQTTDEPTPKLSTKPRDADFPVFFIIIASFTILMIFGLVFISYEMANMGPGDNIAYKLGAAASKKNQ
jgi:hypothetical protein